MTATAMAVVPVMMAAATEPKTTAMTRMARATPMAPYLTLKKRPFVPRNQKTPTA
jgi:hypothetical protein